MANTFKHSGTTGDLIYSLPIVKHFGGGDFYLHLDQINWIGKHYYGAAPQGYHQGRMNQSDFDFLKEFVEYQDYINKFETYDGETAITHNLDRFRKPFVGHPGNYVDIYCSVFGVADSKALRDTPWLTAPYDQQFRGKVIINRTGRWVPNEMNPLWTKWREAGLDANTLFIGLPHEYEQFVQETGWATEYLPCSTLLEQATAINSAELFIGNQSAALAIAIGLGQHYRCEARRDLPLDRNECYFPDQPKGSYF